MRILKQRLKRVVVFLLALTLLLQPLTAYAYDHDYQYAAGDSSGVIKIRDLGLNQILPAGAIMLVDFYNENYQWGDIFNRWLCDALFYVQEEGVDYMSSVVKRTEDTTDSKSGTLNTYNTDPIFILESRYNDREVEGWLIKRIVDSGQRSFENGISMEDGITPYNQDDYTYPILDVNGQIGEKVFGGYGVEGSGDPYYHRYIRYWLIEVKPIYVDPLVRFDSQGGSDCDPIVVHKDENYGINGDLPTPTWENHTFKGWFTASDGDDQITEDNIKLTDEDETLYAHWEEEEQQYTIHFNSNGGTGTMDDMTLKDSEPGILPDNGFAYDGGTFQGWNTAENGTGLPYSEGAPVDEALLNIIKGNDGEVTLYAVWKPFPTVTFDPRGGSECDPSSKKVAKDAEYGTLPETTKTGHEFLGWFTDPVNGDNITETKKKTTDENETLYAHWREYQYTIHFNPNFERGGG